MKQLDFIISQEPSEGNKRKSLRRDREYRQKLVQIWKSLFHNINSLKKKMKLGFCLFLGVQNNLGFSAIIKKQWVSVVIFHCFLGSIRQKLYK